MELESELEMECERELEFASECERELEWASECVCDGEVGVVEEIFVIVSGISVGNVDSNVDKVLEGESSPSSSMSKIAGKRLNFRLFAVEFDGFGSETLDSSANLAL